MTKDQISIDIDRICSENEITRNQFFEKLDECEDHVILVRGDMLNPLHFYKNEILVYGNIEECEDDAEFGDSIVLLRDWIKKIGITK